MVLSTLSYWIHVKQNVLNTRQAKRVRTNEHGLNMPHLRGHNI